MNKDKLKQEFEWNRNNQTGEKFWSWITSNFISKEEVEGLKMEKKELDGLMKFIEVRKEEIDKYGYSNFDVDNGYNIAVDEINSKINNLIEK